MLSRLLLALGLGIVTIAPTANADEPAKSKPNIIVIIADDLGYADVGFHGSKDIPTPHLDSLAKSGTRFTSGYVSCPYCSPTRAGFLTGRYQTRFGHEFNPGNAEGGNARNRPRKKTSVEDSKIGLPLTEVTVADRLKKAGYSTGLVGKWHLGNAPEYNPTKRGFDEFFGFLGGAHPYLAESPGSPISLVRGETPIKESEYLTDAIQREAVDFVERHHDHPFFLYLAFNAVHTPLQATDKYTARFQNIKDPKRKTYAAMLSALDDAVGQVLKKVSDHKLEENTLIFFIADNGGPIVKGTTINGSINEPLRSGKRFTLEGGIRVPFVASWKGHIPADKVDDRPVIALDIHPTVLAAAGVPIEESFKLDGVNLLPYLEGKDAGNPHDVLLWRFGKQFAIRKGDWKLVKHDDSPPQLYNLKEDIGESKDLIAAQPAIAKELTETWEKWNKELVPPLWSPNVLP